MSVRRFDIRSFLLQHNIPIHEHGEKNVRRGEVNIECPFCGDDPSWHLGINPAKGVWACWRDHSHRGRGYVRLVRQLLGCSTREARHIVESQLTVVAPDASDLAAVASGEMFNREDDMEGETRPDYLSKDLPDEFRQLWKVCRAARPYLNYLANRGLVPAGRVAEQYKLHYAIRGRWQGRVIFTFEGDGRIIGWTGRTLGTEGPRYLNSSGSNALPLIYNYEGALSSGGTILYIVEGPFDALKVDYCSKRNIRAVALTGLHALGSIRVESWLAPIIDEFEKVRVLLDNSAWAQQIAFESLLASRFGKKVEGYSLWQTERFKKIYSSCGDPGELTGPQIRRFLC